MDLPDPAELFDYYSRLHDAGFGDVTARVIVAAAVTGYVRPETVELAPHRSATPDEVEDAMLRGLRGDLSATCELAPAGSVTGDHVHVKCEPSLASPHRTYLYVERGHAFLSRDETILLRDTLTAILDS